MENTITPQLLTALAGVILSLCFEYIPKFHTWYNNLEDTVQRLIMLGSLVLVSAGLYGMACAGWLQMVSPGFQLACNEQGLWGLVSAFVFAMIANQSTYLLSPKKE